MNLWRGSSLVYVISIEQVAVCWCFCNYNCFCALLHLGCNSINLLVSSNYFVHHINNYEYNKELLDASFIIIFLKQFVCFSNLLIPVLFMVNFYFVYTVICILFVYIFNIFCN